MKLTTRFFVVQSMELCSFSISGVRHWGQNEGLAYIQHSDSSQKCTVRSAVFVGKWSSSTSILANRVYALCFVYCAWSCWKWFWLGPLVAVKWNLNSTAQKHFIDSSVWDSSVWDYFVTVVLGKTMGKTIWVWRLCVHILLVQFISLRSICFCCYYLYVQSRKGLWKSWNLTLSAFLVSAYKQLPMKHLILWPITHTYTTAFYKVWWRHVYAPQWWRPFLPSQSSLAHRCLLGSLVVALSTHALLRRDRHYLS